MSLPYKSSYSSFRLGTLETIMELIKPFLKYSRIYRSTTAESSKSVRKFIYKLWSKETECIRAALKNHHHHQTQYYAKCLFCNEAGDSDDDVFCKYCFFPRLGIDEEFATYCLLSACFYESNGNGIDNNSQRTVYMQRLKMTWYDYERLGKLYEVSYPQCYQCHSKTNNVGAKFTYFNDAMFCNNCMFPLFNIVIYNIK
uniref:Ac52 n=1 Tax=Spodoptera exigua multiple nucleopolyhedrovirus TaxID=10454 RepID=A0A6N0C2S4_9ABAC|nr:hypothetical protein [Spodoptera exigua multiple nucleopolyhedrovirus]